MQNPTIPAVFDPVAYISDLRSEGYCVEPVPGREMYHVGCPDGFHGDDLWIWRKWEVAKKAAPDWKHKVICALRAEACAA
ncbi:MAG: hypothetical protein ACLQIQ_07470 [Beijerinckiaceae bacterium]